MDKVLYRHIKPCGETFYIGIGNKYRPYSNDYRNVFWKKITNKYPDYEVQIVKSNLTWEDACELEKILISWYGRRDLNKGTLCNMTDGGEGCVGHVYSEKTIERFKEIGRQRMTEKYKQYMLSFNIGKFVSEETRIKSSIANTGRKNSELSKLNISNGKINKAIITSRSVIDTETNKIWSNMKTCARDNNINYSTLITYLRGIRPNKTNLKLIDKYNNK